MYINALINGSINIRAFIDSGCLNFSTVSEQFAKKKDLYLIPIQPRYLQQVVKEENPPTIDYIASFQLDLDGFTERALTYVIPGQADDLILGKRWMEKHDASLRPAKGKITLRKPFRFTLTSKPIQTNKTITEISAIVLKTIQTRARKQGNKDQLQVFSVSLYDIQKAL